MSDFKIIKAQEGDIEVILGIQKRSFVIQAEIYNNYNIPPLLETVQDVEWAFKNKIIYKVIHGSEIVGSFRLNIGDDGCLIERISVDIPFQNRGIGKIIMDFIEKNYSYISRHYLFTGHKSERNLHLYQKSGFIPYKIVKGEGTTDIVYLEKKYHNV